MEKIHCLSAFRKELIVFIDELIQLLPDDKELFVMRGFANSVIMTDVIEYIIKNLVPLEPMVKSRQEDYFLNNAIMFERLQNRESQVNHFKTLWENTNDVDNKEAVWCWLEHFIMRAKDFNSRFLQSK